MRTVKLTCPQCQATLRCSKQPRGDRIVTCPKCALSFVPQQSAPSQRSRWVPAIIVGMALMACGSAAWWYGTRPSEAGNAVSPGDNTEPAPAVGQGSKPVELDELT